LFSRYRRVLIHSTSTAVEVNCTGVRSICFSLEVLPVQNGPGYWNSQDAVPHMLYDLNSQCQSFLIRGVLDVEPVVLYNRTVFAGHVVEIAVSQCPLPMDQGVKQDER
jgi:hypothetical protein